MEEQTYISTLTLANGDCFDDIVFAGDKEKLMDSLENNSYTEFHYENEKGEAESTFLINSCNIDVIEIDEQGGLHLEIDKAKESEAKVVDITGVLDKLCKTDAKTVAESGVRKNNDESVTMEKKLSAVLSSEFPFDTAKRAKLYDSLIGVFSSVAGAIMFFMEAQEKDEVAESVIINEVGEAIRDWMKSLGFDEDVILNATESKAGKIYVIDDIFSTAVNSIEKKANG